MAYDRVANLLFDSGWSSNTITNSAWPLIAGLLKNDPGLEGILFWAVGAGDPAWDATHTAPSPAATQLVDEVDRHEVLTEDIVYLDQNKNPVQSPTTRVRITVSFEWPEQDQTLREFGLFGGDATRSRNSGYLVNCVIHPRIDLTAGDTLSRQIWLTLRPDIQSEWLEAPGHWLSASSVQELDGVGAAYASALADASIETIGDLANSEPTAVEVNLPFMKLVELRAKARLTLNAVTQLSAASTLLDRTAWEVIVTPAATLAAEAESTVHEVERLREQVDILQLAMDNRFLRRSTIGELVQPL